MEFNNAHSIMTLGLIVSTFSPDNKDSDPRGPVNSGLHLHSPLIALHLRVTLGVAKTSTTNHSKFI